MVLQLKADVDEINSNLSFPAGVRFYHDVKDSVRGYNTDPARGADTFCPFRSSPTIKYIGAYEGKAKTYSCIDIPGYNNLTAENFVFKNIRAKANSGSQYTGTQVGNPIWLSYNNNTGALTASGGYAGEKVYAMATAFADIYVVL